MNELVQAISTYTKLNKYTYWTGDCPMCGNKGTLFVNEDLERFFCFACGAKGNSIETFKKLFGEVELQ